MVASAAKPMGGGEVQDEGLQPHWVWGASPWLKMTLAWSWIGEDLIQNFCLPHCHRHRLFVLGGGGLTCDLGFSGEMLGFLCPGCGMDGHAPVTPCANVVVFGCHLDDVLLASIGICDGVRCPIRQLDLRAVAGRKHGQGKPWHWEACNQRVYLSQRMRTEFSQRFGEFCRGSGRSMSSGQGCRARMLQLHLSQRFGETLSCC